MSRETSFTDALGLDVPIVQAPIGSATCPALAAAVADAGALGMLAVTWRDEAATRGGCFELRAAAQIGARPARRIARESAVRLGPFRLGSRC